jgi:hypothetical protein
LPVSLAEAPYLDAIVETDEGIVQLIKVLELRDSLLAAFEQKTALPGSWAETAGPASEFKDSDTMK